MKRWAILGVLALVGLAPWARAEILPTFSLEWEVLHAKLIVEARPIAAATVEVARVHLGEVKPGTRLTLRRFDDLPRIAFEDWSLARGEDAGIPVKDHRVVLFLEPTEGGEWEPVAWGSGVKWIVEERVFGYSQPINPGSYVLVPDREAKDLGELRTLIAAEMERRRAFEKALAHLAPKERARELLGYVFSLPPGAYSIEAHAAFRGAGPEAAQVLREAARTPRPAKERLTLAELILLAGAGGAQYPACGVEQEAWPVVDRIPAPMPDWRSLSKDQQEAIGLWHSAIELIASDSSPTGNQNATLVKALSWGVQHRDSHVVGRVADGLARAPDPGNVPALAAAVRDWPIAETGRGGVYSPHVREGLVRALAAQRLPQAVPALAALLGDSQEGVREEARRGLTRIVGEDLGTEPSPWLAWLENLAKSPERTSK